MEVAYTAKADSDITCIAETDPEQWTGDDPDVGVRVRGVRARRHGRHRGRHPAVGDREAAAAVATRSTSAVVRRRERAGGGSDDAGAARPLGHVADLQHLLLAHEAPLRPRGEVGEGEVGHDVEPEITIVVGTMLLKLAATT